MSEKESKFNNIRLNKKEFHKSKEPIDLLSIDVDQIVVSYKFKHNDEGFKHFISYFADFKQIKHKTLLAETEYLGIYFFYFLFFIYLFIYFFECLDIQFFSSLTCDLRDTIVVI